MNLAPVVILSYYFPPHGGAGTQRFAKFAKHLPQYGFRPTVVSSDERVAPGCAPSHDQSLADDIGELTRVIRVPESAVCPTLRDRLIAAARFNTDIEPWARAAAPIVARAVRDCGAPAFIITCSPYSAAAIGPTIRAQTGARFILDLRDPWSLEGWRTSPSSLHAALDRRAMISALRSADAVIANTPASRDAFITLAGLDATRIVTIPNGFDDDDFQHPAALPGDQFRIVHVGTLHAVEQPPRRLRHALRTRHRDIDETARSGRYLFEAVARVKSQRPDIASTLKIDLIGQVHPSHTALARKLGIGENIVQHGYLPHRAAVAAMQAADLVFVPLHALHSAGPELIVPGKLYEALAGGRPVLACVPEGDAARLVRASEGGVVCPPDDPDRIASALAAAFDARSTNHAWRGADRSLLAPFQRTALTQRLARVLDAVIHAQPISPGPDPFDQVEAATLRPVVSIQRMSHHKQTVAAAS